MPQPPTHWIEPVLARYERPLLQYAASLCPAPEDARDVVQETFLKLAGRGPLEAAHLAPWLFKVCRNGAMDLHRKGKRQLPMDPNLPEPASEAPAPDSQLAQKEESARLLRLLGHLPENQREVLRLRFQAGLSYAEIAQATSLGVGNVGFLIHTGLKRLRQLWPQTLEANE